MGFDGCSVLPPRGGSWFVREGPGRVHFRRPTEEWITVFALATVLENRSFEDLESYRRFLVEDSGRTVGRLRNPRAEFEIVEDADPPYVRGTFRVEDHGVPGAEGKVFVTESRSRFYLHPEDGRQIVLTVSQRVPRGRTPLDLDAEVEPFLDSLEIDG